MADQKSKGIALLISSAFFFALMSVFVRLSGNIPSIQKMVFRNGVSAAVAAVMLLRSGEGIHVPKAAAVPLFFRSACGFFSVMCNYYAIDHLVLANSNSLSKLSPFFAIAFAAFFLGEKVTKGQLGAIALALIGSGFLVIPSLNTLGLSAVIGLIGGILSGGAHVALRALRKHNISNSTVVFIFSGCSLLLVLIPTLPNWHPMTAMQWVYLLCAGTSCALAQYSLTAAYRFAAPREISVYDFTQIIFSGIMGYLVFGQIPGFYSWCAYVFIIAASGLLYWNNKKTQ